MPDSSTGAADNKAPQPDTENHKEPKLVPVKAVAEERAKKQAARDEVDKLREDNKNRDQFDSEVIDQVVAQAKAAIDRELEPLRKDADRLRQENERLKKMTKLGLSQPQADKFMELLDRIPGLTDEQALVLARAESPAVFGVRSSGFLGGGLPVTGESLARGLATAETDHMKLMHEARASKDFVKAREHAAMEFERRFLSLRRPT